MFDPIPLDFVQSNLWESQIDLNPTRSDQVDLKSGHDPKLNDLKWISPTLVLHLKLNMIKHVWCFFLFCFWIKVGRQIIQLFYMYKKLIFFRFWTCNFLHREHCLCHHIKEWLTIKHVWCYFRNNKFYSTNCLISSDSNFWSDMNILKGQTNSNMTQHVRIETQLNSDDMICDSTIFWSQIDSPGPLGSFDCHLCCRSIFLELKMKGRSNIRDPTPLLSKWQSQTLLFQI